MVCLSLDKMVQKIFQKNASLLQRFLFPLMKNALLETVAALEHSYQCMVSDAELIPNVEVSNNVFHAIVRLYIRVRSFSCAKDIIQRYKINAKQSKLGFRCRSLVRMKSYILNA